MPQWSNEIFVISDVILRNPVVYKLSDFNKEVISGTFYGQELQIVEPVFQIENIIRRSKGKALVKWVGYDTPTWEPTETVL